MAKLETVQVQSPQGPVTINKSDFDSSKHKLVGEKGVSAAPAAPKSEDKKGSEAPEKKGA